MKFFSSVILHLDILACASTRLRPQYADICAAALGDGNSKVMLERIMGCENWAMVLIREIAVLWDWKRRSERAVLSTGELERQAGDIKWRLNVGLEKLSKEPSQSPKREKAQHDRGFVIRRITNVYANAAKVYLDVLVFGPNPDLPEMIESVSSTLAALAALPDPNRLRNVVWPFCIAGCIAKVGQREVFRDLASAAGVHQGVFGSSWRALEVMEKCWALRDEGKSCDWFVAMQALGHHVLLV
jgi:hypothetical protein